MSGNLGELKKRILGTPRVILLETSQVIQADRSRAAQSIFRKRDVATRGLFIREILISIYGRASDFPGGRNAGPMGYPLSNDRDAGYQVRH